MTKDPEPLQKNPTFNQGEWLGVAVVIILMAAWPAYFLIKNMFFPS
ncbi:MAG: hypothetical protein QM488_05715 [Rhizobiaceae bacterium]